MMLFKTNPNLVTTFRTLFVLIMKRLIKESCVSARADFQNFLARHATQFAEGQFFNIPTFPLFVVSRASPLFICRIIVILRRIIVYAVAIAIFNTKLRRPLLFTSEL